MVFKFILNSCCTSSANQSAGFVIDDLVYIKYNYKKVTIDDFQLLGKIHVFLLGHQIQNTIVRTSGYLLSYLVSRFRRFTKYVSHFLALHSSDTAPNVITVSYIAIQTSDKTFRKPKQTLVTYRS